MIKSLIKKLYWSFNKVSYPSEEGYYWVKNWPHTNKKPMIIEVYKSNNELKAIINGVKGNIIYSDNIYYYRICCPYENKKNSL